MQLKPTIIFREHEEIDKAAWDECIATGHINLVYGYSFYLDKLAPGWKALTDEQYNWMFVITHKKKYGVAYLYQPVFTQQLGFFKRHESVDVPYSEVFAWLKKHYRFWEINLNIAPKEFKHEKLSVTKGTNFILSLSAPFNSLQQQFAGDLHRNLKQAAKHDLTYSYVDDAALAVDVFKEHYSLRLPQVKQSHYHQFKLMIAEAGKKNMLICRQATDKNDNLLAIALLLYDGRRLYNMMNTTTAAGRHLAANHFLLSRIIEEFSGRDIVFDFEGSDLPGVQTFYKNFGAENQPYYQVKFNDLRWPYRLLKQ